MKRSTALRLSALAIALLMSASPLAACSSTAAGNGANATTSISSGSHLDPTAFATAMVAPNTVLIDVRTPSEFAAGHISGAVNIDVESPDFTSQIANLDKTKTYALYCHSGRRSGIAMQTMQSAGFSNVFDLSGGVQNWQASGQPLVTN